MPDNRTIIDQMRDRQQRIFRIAQDPTRVGLTLKIISADSGLGYDSLRKYASGETIMPITALDALVDVIPDDLLSLLLPGDRMIVRVPAEIDHDGLAEDLHNYLRAKTEAHHPDSPCGREISPCEDTKLREMGGRIVGRV